MTPLHPEFLGGQSSAREHIILFTGPTGSGPAAAVCSISDVTTAHPPAEAPTSADLVTHGVEHGEILLGVDDILLLSAIEGAPTAQTSPELSQKATGVVVFVPADADHAIDGAMAGLDRHIDLARRGGAVVAITRSQEADPRFSSRMANVLIERFPTARIPVFTVDPWKREQLTAVLLTVIAGVESHTLYDSDVTA